MINFVVMILSGGKGIRLRSVISSTQKTIVKVNGKPFLSYILDKINNSGLNNVVLCTGYKGESLKKTYGNKYKNLNLIYSQEDRPLGTGGALRLGMEKLHSDYYIIFNGDSYINFNLIDFIYRSIEAKTDISICLANVKDISRYGQIKLDGDRITEFKEKSFRSISGIINAGVYMIKKEVLQNLPFNRMLSIETDFFPKFIEKGIFGYLSKSEFIDIGTPESLKRAESFLACQKII